MNFFQEYALLFAVAIPVAVIVLIEVALRISGERDTLLLPGFARFPTVMSEAEMALPVPEAETALPMLEPELATVLADAPAVASTAPANDKVEALEAA